MSQHLDVVASRLKNMLLRITKQDPDFDDMCSQHAEVTAEIRKMRVQSDATAVGRAEELQRRRAALEDQIFAILSQNTRV